MSKEQPPNLSNVIDFEKRKREIEDKRKARKRKEKENLDNPIDLEREKINRRRYFENEICRIGDDKWIALAEFANKTIVVYPLKQDKYQAKQIKGMTDEELLFHFKITNKEFYNHQPLTFKTLYEEIEGRMKGLIN